MIAIPEHRPDKPDRFTPLSPSNKGAVIRFLHEAIIKAEFARVQCLRQSQGDMTCDSGKSAAYWTNVVSGLTWLHKIAEQVREKKTSRKK